MGKKLSPATTKGAEKGQVQRGGLGRGQAPRPSCASTSLERGVSDPHSNQAAVGGYLRRQPQEKHFIAWKKKILNFLRLEAKQQPLHH